MTKSRLLILLAMLSATMAAGAQAVLHSVSVNVQLSADYAIVTEVRDLSPGGLDEGFVTIHQRHVTRKFIMNVCLNDGKDFQRLDWWKSSATTAEKQGKCGRRWVDDRHARYCWGIDPAVRKKYFVTYPLAGLLYNDGTNDVLEYDFLDLAGQAPAQRVVMEVYPKGATLSADDIDLAHSSTDVDITVADGVAVIRPKATGAIASMPLRLAFRPGFFGGLPAGTGGKITEVAGKGGAQAADTTAKESPALRDGSLPFEIPESELHSAMMSDSSQKTESAALPLFEYFYAYPKTCILLCTLLVVLLGVAFRYWRILRMKMKKEP